MMAPGRNGMQRKIITGAGKWGRGDDILIISGNVRLDGGSCAGSTYVESNSSKALSLIVIIHLYLTYVLLISVSQHYDKRVSESSKGSQRYIHI